MSNCGLHCLKINHIGVQSGGAVILQDVNLHAHCGELTAVIGRNGAGKSTLLKAVMGEIAHTGNVEFSGHAPQRGKSRALRPRIGYVPQSLAMDAGSPATVYDLALTFTSAYPVFLPRRRRSVEQLREHFRQFSAGELLDKPAGRLSGGELQRVLLAIATLPKPDLLILDEPVSGVDRAGLQQFYSLLERLKAEDMIILLVSHDLPYVRRAADRVVLLDQTVLQAGKPEDVFASEAFHRAFPEEGGGRR